uniref:Nonstructural protein n=1 Tax=Caenorhabditis tropicalis TaxID=1561998 RepID=A0A1I7UH68_9PELO
MCCVYYATNMIRRRPGSALEYSDIPNRKYEGEFIKYDTRKYGSDFCVAYNVTRATGDFRDDGLEPISLVLHATSHYMREIEGQQMLYRKTFPLPIFNIPMMSFIQKDYGSNSFYFNPRIFERLVRRHKLKPDSSVRLVIGTDPYQFLCLWIELRVKLSNIFMKFIDVHRK